MGEKFLMKGNEAIAESAIRNGCRHFYGYPITPQTEVSAYMAKAMPKIGGTFLQAESEIAAINMVLGTSACGLRTMTSSSSPGISLKSECISYLAGCDLPCVILNVMRGGPGLGGIQPSQSDYWQATKATGHGDFHLLVYAPSTVQEIVDLIGISFDKSEQYRVPAMILADGLIGQMMEPVEFPEHQGASTPDSKPYATTGTKNKRPPNIVNSLLLDPRELEQTNIERFERYEIINRDEVMAEQYLVDDAEIIVVAYGMTARIVRTVVDQLRENGVRAGMLRPITLYPFPKAILNKISQRVKKFMVVEMSMGQMVEDVQLSVCKDSQVNFFGRTGGVVMTPNEVYDNITKMLGIHQDE